MPMRVGPAGVHRVPRGEDRPPDEYDIIVDGETAGWAERLPAARWRFYRDGQWPREFARPGAFLAGEEWIAGLHRAAAKPPEPVPEPVAAEAPPVRPEPPAGVLADPFRGDAFADPLAP